MKFKKSKNNKESKEMKRHTTNKKGTKLPGLLNFWSEKTEIGLKREKGDTNESKKQRITVSERYQRYMDEEKRLRLVEDELVDPNIEPHTPEQFERALMKDKNSSFMYIKYMAFHLETSEVQKARTIGKKAVATINFREEKELLNVWIALLNLEIRYGTDETYNEVLREAAQRNDPFKVYSQTLSILLEVEKFEEATKIVEILKKKYKSLPETWLQIGESYLKMRDEKLAKEILPKSLLSIKITQRE